MVMEDNHLSTEEEKKLAMIKFALLAKGAQLSKSAHQALIDAKKPVRARSGVSGGLDVVMPHNVYVNVPVGETFARNSDILLDYADGRFIIRRNDDDLAPIDLLPIPQYYGKKTADGSEDMVRIGQMCSGDRFCYGMTGPGCYFWKRDKRCKFCSIGDNYNADASRKKARHLLEVLDHAINDPVHPAKHVLLGGGTPLGEDMGAVLASSLCRAIKARFDISVYIMIAAPLKNKYIDMLCDAGVDELGMNLEFWSDAAWKEYIPGKNKEIGKKRYLEALEYSVRKIGPINTRTIFVAGLEEPTHTIEGANMVASMGIMPIISPFRPLDGTMLEHARGFDAETYYEIFDGVNVEALKHEIPVGPTCICCQNNTLALPFGKHYRFY